jgi:hypothetical protein
VRSGGGGIDWARGVMDGGGGFVAGGGSAWNKEMDRWAGFKNPYIDSFIYA